MRLLDVTCSGGIIAWLQKEGKNTFIPCVFEPQFYLYGATEQMRAAKEQARKAGAQTTWQRVKTFWGARWMLRVQCQAKDRDWLARRLQKDGELFDADVPVEELFLFEHDVFIGAQVEAEYDAQGRITKLTTNERTTDDYELPSLQSCEINLDGDDIILDGERYKDVEFTAAFNALDPDIVLAQDADIAQLCKRGITFSRFGNDRVRGTYGSYFSYGKVLYREPTVHFTGRLHLRAHGTIYGSWSLRHAWEEARLCHMTLQHANARSVGSCMNNLQRKYAYKEGYAVASTWSLVERWRSGLDLFYADRGPLIIEALPGRYEDVAAIDFTSLYPAIMVKYNISTETLFCKCCPHNKVPGMDVNICTRATGIMPKLLLPLIERRAQYKARGGDEREHAIKSLLVTCFGYMGFRKSRMARIEAHQAILAYARETLLEAMKVCEERGFEVVHAYTDCMWIRKEGVSEREIESVINDIESQIGLKIKSEGIYDWIRFLPATQEPDISVPVRYVGTLRDGATKVRGVELRRRDTPPLIRGMQEAMVSDLAAGRNPSARLREVITRLRKGNVLPEQLEIVRVISKEKYKGGSAQAVIVEQLKKEGIKRRPGQRISYVIRDAGSKIANNRYSIDSAQYDRVAYMRMARRAAKNLGVREERQATLMEILMEKIIMREK